MRSWFLAACCWCTLANAQPASEPALRYATPLAGSGLDAAAGVATGRDGNVWVAGTTASPDFPVRNALQSKQGGTSFLRIDGGQFSWSYSTGISAPFALAASTAQPGLVFAGDANGLHKSADGGDTWTLLPSAPSRVVTLDPSDPKVLYAAGSSGVFKSTDGGLTWASPGQALAAVAVYVDPNRPQILLSPVNPTGLFRSIDGGATWSLVFGRVNSVAFDAGRPGVVFAVAPDNLYESTDDGATWFSRTDNNPSPGGSRIFPDPFHAGTLYTNLANYLFRSRDDGVTWSQAPGVKVDYVPSFVADPSTKSVYASTGSGVILSSDGFMTFQNAGPPAVPAIQALSIGAGGRLYVGTGINTDVFVTKLDSSGNILYSTFLGGSSDDTATAIAVDAAGSVYITGETASADFPVTPGAYLARNPGTAAFLTKLAPDGSLVYSTYFADGKTTPKAIAVSGNGEAYLTGVTSGGLPVTSGAVQSTIVPACGFIPCNPVPTGIAPIFQEPARNAFLARFSANGSALLACTYWGDSKVEADAIAVDSDGAAYLAVGEAIYVLDPGATTILRSTKIDGAVIAALAMDTGRNLYLAGGTKSKTFYTSPRAFQPAVVTLPQLPGQGGGGQNAFVAKMAPDLSILYSTLLGGEREDAATGIAVDSSGIATVAGYANSRRFPLRAPFQTSFSAATGFLARVNADGTALLYSTYVGDNRPFLPQSVALDPDGNAVFAGHTTGNVPSGISSISIPFYAADAFVARVDASPAPAVILNSVVNAASLLGGSIAPGETLLLNGQGFGGDAQVLVDDAALAPISISSGQITVTIPAGFQPETAASIQVKSGGVVSNAVLVPVAGAAPGVFSTDGSGVGQGYILNADGTLNSPSNPTPEGGMITIFATGVGTTSRVNQSDVTAQPVNVFIDGFYANGVDAHVRPAPGLPGDIYEITVFVPHPADLVASNPNLLNFKMPPTVGVVLQTSGVSSQQGLSLSVK